MKSLIPLLLVFSLMACSTSKHIETHTSSKDTTTNRIELTTVKDTAIHIAAEHQDIKTDLEVTIKDGLPKIKDTLITQAKGHLTTTIYIHDNKLETKVNTAAYDLIITNLRVKNVLLTRQISNLQKDTSVTTCNEVKWYHELALRFMIVTLLLGTGYIAYRIYIKRG